MNELGVLAEMLVREVEELHHAINRSDMLEIELQLLGPQFAEYVLENGNIEAIFAPEIVVDHARIDAGLSTDGQDPGTAIALLGEFSDCCAQDPLPGAFWQ